MLIGTVLCLGPRALQAGRFARPQLTALDLSLCNCVAGPFLAGGKKVPPIASSETSSLQKADSKAITTLASKNLGRHQKLSHSGFCGATIFLRKQEGTDLSDDQPLGNLLKQTKLGSIRLFIATSGRQNWSSTLTPSKEARCLFSLRATSGTAEKKGPPQIQAMASERDGVPKERKPSKVAVAQMRSTGDIEANFQSVAKLVKDATNAGCSMLFLPESFSFIGTRGSEGVAIAEPLEGPLMGRYRQLARDHAIWLSLGGFQETSADADRLHNTHVIVDDAGEITAVYRKIHLFDVDVPNGPKLLESASTAPGSELVVTASPAGRLGVTTCYDLRFPQMYQQLRFGHGAEILLVPSAFTKTTGEAHWEVLLRARAIECQCYVIAAAQAGRHNEKRESFGDALIIDPWGRIVARLDDPLATGIATAEVDLAALQSIRTSMPVAQHRRYDIYGETATNESLGVRSTL